MAYNLSWTNNVTSLTDIVVGINTATNNLFSIIILLIVFIITYGSTIKNGSTTAMVAGGLTTTIVATLLWIIGISSLMVLISAPLIIFLFGLAINFFNR